MRLRRRKREWVPTGETRIYWGQGGAVRLDGEQRDVVDGKTRWTTARWLPLEEYHALIRHHLAERERKKAK